MTDRARLPDRRLNMTVPLNWQGNRLDVTIGFHESGMVREVFINGAKVGSEIEGVLQDAAVMISLLLQLYLPPAALARSVGRHRPAAAVAAVAGGAKDGPGGVSPQYGPPTSIIGQIADELVAAEAQFKGPLAEAYLSAQRLRRPSNPTIQEDV